jgi:capsular exopolysaccharide synthesis family protein
MTEQGKQAWNTIEFGKTPSLPYSVEEAVNRLRINVSFLGSDVRKIMVISSEPNEGKSFVAINLWNQMAEAGEKVILIDADMRNSTMYDKYQLKHSDGSEIKGLSHYLSGNAELEEVLGHTIYGQGDLLPNTENIVNPSMMLESAKFSELMDEITRNYRYVFIDSPPLGIVSDGERLGSFCDGAILCVRSAMTPKAVVKNSVRQLERSGCPLLGIVLNRVSESKGKYGKYGKYGYGGYYGGYYGTGDK